MHSINNNLNLMSRNMAENIQHRINELVGRTSLIRRSIRGDARISFNRSQSLESSICTAKEKHLKMPDNFEDELDDLDYIKPKNRIDRLTMYEKDWADIMSSQANGSESEESEDENGNTCTSFEECKKTKKKMKKQKFIENMKMIGKKCKTLTPFDYSDYINKLNEEQIQNNCMRSKVCNIKNGIDRANMNIESIRNSCNSYNNLSTNEIRNLML